MRDFFFFFFPFFFFPLLPVDGVAIATSPTDALSVQSLATVQTLAGVPNASPKLIPPAGLAGVDGAAVAAAAGVVAEKDAAGEGAAGAAWRGSGVGLAVAPPAGASRAVKGGV